ncbi:MAG: tetratricopeptide repeat protein [Candidatus Obscuribacterales bacterium]|nr:tetratricopeptide repeat protein [Candidatus Obscuribacterales bacterium]
MVKKRIIESITSTDTKSRRWKSLFASAKMAYEAGELRQAESLLARARELAHELPEHIFAEHATQIGIAAIYLAKKKPRDAESLLRRSLSVLESNPDPALKELYAVSLRFHADALRASGDENEAEKTLKKSAAILEDLGNDAAVQLGYTLCDLSGLYLLQGRLSEAQEYIETAMAILFVVLGPEAPEYTRADMIFAASKYSDADELKDMAADGIMKMEYMFGEHHPNITRALDRYMKVLAQKGDESRLEAAKERFGIKAVSKK